LSLVDRRQPACQAKQLVIQHKQSASARLPWRRHGATSCSMTALKAKANKVVTRHNKIITRKEVFQKRLINERH
jgi:hypothetical protein